MDLRVACRVGDPTRPNEDSFVVLPGFVAVLDGVSAIDGLDSGCCHGPAWYASRLAANLTFRYLAVPEAALSELLASAIESVRDEHGGTCDLDHPGTPQSTFAALRFGTERCDYLVLCDSTIVLDVSGTVETITDRRILSAAQGLRRRVLAGTTPIGSDEQTQGLRALALEKREWVNRPGGYWIAAANPAAARHAVQGSIPTRGPRRLTRAALMTDGASCLVDQYHLTDWKGLLDLAHTHGPHHVIDLARSTERADSNGYQRPRPKAHDDGTIAYCVLSPEVHP